MKKPIEITKGSTYIFVGKKALNNRNYSKFKILEVTETTYLIKNIDADVTFRSGIVDFNNDYKPVEVIESYEQYIAKIIKELQPV